MRSDPILASRRFAPGTFDGNRCAMSFRVEGGLRHIAGNSAPYFALTYTAHRAGFPNQCESGGAGHETILRYFPQFADLAALHLSTIDGVPMHAIANAWYWLAGASAGHYGEKYHGGNSKGHYPRAVQADDGAADHLKIVAEYREPTLDECLDVFARHCRIGIGEADTIRKTVARAVAEGPRDDSERDGVPRGKATLAAFLDAMRPRWRAEAAACIQAHSLRVYGDPWTPPAQEVAV